VQVGTERRPTIIEKLDSVGLSAEHHGRSAIRFRLGSKDLAEKRDAIEDLLRVAEEWSHR